MRLTVRLDPVQGAWVVALAELNGCTHADVLRQAVRYLAAKESARMTRTRYYAAVALAARAAAWDPITDYLSGREITPP